MKRWLLAAVLLAASPVLVACPICMGGGRPSTGQQLVVLRQAVLAAPGADAGSYRVVAVIKGERPPGAIIESAAVQSDAGTTGSRPLLLVRDDAWPVWASLGTIGVEHASWLRQLAAGKRAMDMAEDEWRIRVARMLPYLEHREPLVAEIAYGEVAAAPYAALAVAKSQLAAPKIRRWLADPKLAQRQPLYLLLLGIAGDARDAARVEDSLEAAWEAGDATNVASLIAADLQLRGPSRLAWVEARYLRDHGRSTREVEAALLALGAHGNADGVIPRERVIESYRMFMRERKELAGLVAPDLAAWQYWDAVPDYVALMQSDVRQQYASRVAILAYLMQSPAGAQGIEPSATDRDPAQRAATAGVPSAAMPSPPLRRFR
jgi:hypothetical protein